MRVGISVAVVLALASCERKAPTPPDVREIAAVPEARVYVSWIEGHFGEWHWWLADLENVRPVEVAVFDAGRIDQMSLTRDGRFAVLVTSESSDPRNYERQRVWIADLEERRLHRSDPPTTFVYEIGADATSPWLVGSTFRGDYGRARSILARARSDDPGCHPPAARSYRWRESRWELEEELVAGCSSTTGPVASLALELDSTQMRMVPTPIKAEFAFAPGVGVGAWTLSLENGQQLVLNDGDRDVLRRENVAAFTFWSSPPAEPGK